MKNLNIRGSRLVFPFIFALFLIAALAGCPGPGGGAGVGNTGEIEEATVVGPVFLHWAAVGNTAFGDSSVNAAAYGGGIFVAAGDSGKMAHSADGKTWTAVGNSAFGADNIYAVAYGNGAFVAAGANGKMAYSVNGTAWTPVADSTFGAYDINAVAFGGGRFVAGGANGKMAYSEDGKTWTAVAVSTFTRSIYAVGYGGGVFVAAEDSTGKTAYSANGIDWTAGSSGPGHGSYIKAIAWGKGRFVAADANGKMAYSDDNGKTWTSVGLFATDTTLGGIKYTRTLAFAGGRFVTGGSGATAYSNDGANWSTVTIGHGAFGSDMINAIAYGGNRLVAVGAGDPFLGSGGSRIWYTE